MPDHHSFGPFVRRFLLEEVATDRNLSRNTQRSYRDTIRLLLRFITNRCGIDPTRLRVEQINADTVRAFMAHLEKDRGNSAITCNQRLAAIHSLFRFIGRKIPELVEHATQIQAIPLRRAAIPAMAYLEKHEIDALLAVPDRRQPQGRRDYAILLLLYNTGARASELAARTIGDFTLGVTPSVRLLGKGRKTRLCPLWKHTADFVREFVLPTHAAKPHTPVFLNVRGQPITRFGIHALVERTVTKAATTMPSLCTKSVSPHTLRHTTAVHLLRAGVDINTIRAWLGHASLETTNRYAQVDLEMKAKALEQCAVGQPDVPADRIRLWRRDDELMTFLRTL